MVLMLIYIVYVDLTNRAIHKADRVRAAAQNALQRPFLLAASIQSTKGHFSVTEELYQAKLESHEARGFVNRAVDRY